MSSKFTSKFLRGVQLVRKLRVKGRFKASVIKAGMTSNTSAFKVPLARTQARFMVRAKQIGKSIGQARSVRIAKLRQKGRFVRTRAGRVIFIKRRK